MFKELIQKWRQYSKQVEEENKKELLFVIEQNKLMHDEWVKGGYIGKPGRITFIGTNRTFYGFMDFLEN